jgi:hypothetical protein
LPTTRRLANSSAANRTPFTLQQPEDRDVDPPKMRALMADVEALTGRPTEALVGATHL